MKEWYAINVSPFRTNVLDLIGRVCFAGRLRRSEGWALMPGLSWG